MAKKPPTSCSVITDLMKPYVGDTASNDTRQLVDDHLTTCEDCETTLADLRSKLDKELGKADASHINILKKTKKKIRGRNFIILAVAATSAFALGLGGFWFIFHHDTPLAYSEKLLNVSADRVDITLDSQEVATQTLVKLSATKNYYGQYSTSRLLMVDSVPTEVIYLYVTETWSTRWQTQPPQDPILLLPWIHQPTTTMDTTTDIQISDGEITITQSGETSDDQDGVVSAEVGGGDPQPSAERVEIYYLIAEFNQLFDLEDAEFYELSRGGDLLWSGDLA
ncbi:MAG: zf-HC2 domain-containing protein [Propionibacteriaceae bacterium]|nr:zf-HC2 domain-containing protein [Propionibacteriaceae bacterium]